MLFSNISESENRAFPLRSSDCATITSPTEFYETILENIENARSMITLTSLYIGTGEKEQHMVDALRRACEKRPTLRVRIVLDHSRGTRGGKDSSASLMAPLCDALGDQLSVGFFMMPQLWGGIGRQLPQRFNEAVAVQHIKAYVFDDNLLMSGANLSQDYFTNRQDRYMLFRRAENLATVYHDLGDRLLRFSDTLLGRDNGTSMGGHFRLRPVRWTRDDRLLRTLRAELVDFTRSCRGRMREATAEAMAPGGKSYDTWAVPTVQFGHVGIRDDEETLLSVLSSSRAVQHANRNIDVATGYFNMPDVLKSATSCSIDNNRSVRVLFASPEAHGFYGASGIAGALPLAYAERARLFFEESGGTQGHPTLHEYRREGWSFHAKGLWCTAADEDDPWLSVVGSSNFGMRSLNRDIEAQLYVGTTNGRLRNQWKTERDALWEYSERLTQSVIYRDDRVFRGLFDTQRGRWVPLVSRLIAGYM